MKRIIFIVLLFGFGSLHAQNTFQAIIKDEHSGEPLIGATAILEGTDNGAVSDTNGLVVLSNIPNGSHHIVFSFVGFQTHEETYIFPLSDNQPITIFLEEGEELEEITVSATRSTRTIQRIPTRIEFLGAEELTEKAVMNSTNIAMLLRESTGIQMQITSPNSANQSIRIQGLDGRYTQILRDGFPLYGGFAGGLSIMQIPPLDLKQVEVIKGSSSTLYGGGAIAGLVNLVTKKPEEDPELNVMFNQTSASGTTLNTFYAQKFDKVGLSFFGSANRQEPFDPNDDGFSDIPKVRSLTLRPQFFWYPDEKTTFWVNVNATFEDRIGGDIQVIEGNPDNQHVFSEQNLSKRFSTQLSFSRQLNNGAQLDFKNSFGFFDREIIIPDYQFEGDQVASFSEATYSLDRENSQWIFGANLFTDQFEETQRTGSSLRDYTYTTIGAFIQNTVDLNSSLALESGLRLDNNSNHGTFILPRASLLFQFNDHLSGRLGGGLGYKLPSIFTEDAEALAFENILPVNQNNIEAERSVGGNFDLNFETIIGEKMTFSINQFFFYTRLNNALILSNNPSNGSFFYENAAGKVDSKGFETNIKLTYNDFKLFLQYAFIDAKLDFDNVRRQKPLTPKHNAGAILVFEQHGKWRLGLESYYTGSQFLSDNTKTREYWIVGFMALRQFEQIGFFLNFENFIDTRQSRYGDIVIPPVINPTFAEIWAPTDGFVVNGGFIFNLFKKEDHHHH